VAWASRSARHGLRRRRLGERLAAGAVASTDGRLRSVQVGRRLGRRGPGRDCGRGLGQHRPYRGDPRARWRLGRGLAAPQSVAAERGGRRRGERTRHRLAHGGPKLRGAGRRLHARRRLAGVERPGRRVGRGAFARLGACPGCEQPRPGGDGVGRSRRSALGPSRRGSRRRRRLEPAGGDRRRGFPAVRGDRRARGRRCGLGGPLVQPRPMSTRGSDRRAGTGSRRSCSRIALSASSTSR
jgi:hypothetical protein